MHQAQFHGFTINWQSGELSKQGTVTQLEPKLVSVLKVLFDAQGELVSYEQLQLQVWQDVIVAPNALQRVIAQLRKSLGDTAKQQAIIKTHPKRGYSLVFVSEGLEGKGRANEKLEREAFEKQIVKAAHQIKQNLLNQPIALLVVASFLIVIFTSIHLFYKPTTKAEIAQVNLTSLDTQTEQLAQVMPLSKTEFIFIDKQAGNQLVLHNTQSNLREVLLDKAHVYGRMVLVEDKQQLRFGQIIEQNGVKCAELVVLDIKTKALTRILPCQTNFYHTPLFINDETLLFIKTDKQWQSELISLDFKTQQQTSLLAGQIDNAFLSLDKTRLAINFNNQLQMFDLEEHKLETLSLPKNFYQTLSSSNLAMTFSDNGNLWVALDKSLVEYSPQGKVISNTNLASSMQVSELTFIDQQLFALLGRDNHQVRLSSVTQLNDVVDIAPSKFTDVQGKFRPETDEISVLSNRSRSTQIWLQQGEQLLQLTQAGEVTDHIWLDKNRVAYLIENHVWLLSLADENSKLKKLELNVPVKQLLQATANTLYVQSETELNTSLIAIDLKKNNLSTLFEGPFHWAQVLANNTLILNDSSQLKKIVGSQAQAITALPTLTLQGRYYAKGNEVFLQDKQQNVWRYNPTLEQAEIVGRFDENNLFMSDFSKQPLKMLGDNFVKTNNELVKVTFSNN
ncbi:winged helix-turn-helix domain-containing protein [Pseudoalteromonas sp. SS15]|uniref:winged helix-turn-helix domain-containing protein n=1 Tax=Pseudoalteromonas sp. SS15 TaxID=3139393 RepID=UPI003BA903FE